jgi:hypothetical protein
VLVADVKPYDEIVDDGDDGYILSAQNQNEWSEKIIYLLSNKNYLYIWQRTEGLS